MEKLPCSDASMVLLTLSQLRGMLDSILDEKITLMLDAVGKGQKRGEVEYLTTQQALDFIHLSKPTLNKLRREGRITALNSSDKRVLYKRSELVAYLEASKQKGGKASC
ncbi:helix-turn-helix domain-containing protein [Microvirga sp. STS02]|uniref:helix-turn-helix domain-containing protein n=1 Tax=Hymenobacter negativus TaxID=2795026 RepID=UPI0018DBB179|nr:MULTISPECIES: helix-turn-helix domain-containing protein [Bacteria]MBH8567674.1 helix-turn-helix domain-containing protein [Hymenobacter negativus]MBR7207408.1 helix-turn-helix domain-containing protein [Microvirga sp. STS02]